MAHAYVRYPVLLDASAEMMRRRGSAYFMEWAQAMTGLKPKRALVGPRVVASVLREVARLRWAGPPECGGEREQGRRAEEAATLACRRSDGGRRDARGLAPCDT